MDCFTSLRYLQDYPISGTCTRTCVSTLLGHWHRRNNAMVPVFTYIYINVQLTKNAMPLSPFEFVAHVIYHQEQSCSSDKCREQAFFTHPSTQLCRCRRPVDCIIKACYFRCKCHLTWPHMHRGVMACHDFRILAAAQS